MRRVLPKIFLMLMVVLSALQCMCYASMGSKLKRGVTNVLIWPAEIPKHIVNEAAKAEPDYTSSFRGMFYGVPKGVGFALVRAVSGVLDIVTFPLNIPSNWEPLVPVGPFSWDETKFSVTHAQT